MSAPEWVKPGVKCAVVQYGGLNDRDVKFTHILNIGVRHITVAGISRRFRLNLQSAGGDSWGPSYRLAPLDDPEVMGLVAARLRRETAARAIAALKRWAANDAEAQRQHALRLILEAAPPKEP